jgi:hypothetical protein
MRMTLLAATGMFGLAVGNSAAAWATTPQHYLIGAQDALQANEPDLARVDLDRAEAMVRNRPAHRQALRELAKAQVALARGDWLEAENYMGLAMQYRSASATGGGWGGGGGGSADLGAAGRTASLRP